MGNKEFLLISIILIALFLVSVVSAASAADDSKNKITTHQNCILTHKGESTLIRTEYKLCTKNLKEGFKNNTINKTELREGTKNCTKNYLAGLKKADKKRKECFKNSNVNCEKQCKGENNNTRETENNQNEDNKKRIKCTERSDVCTTLYDPVCGWFNSSIQCLAYPCAADYSNSCAACGDVKVDYWTPGECPKNIGN
ncbi:MAG: hypothetical protein AABX54_00460 [Nanoarchaeota archaeon]